MELNPTVARKILESSPVVIFRDEREKLSCFQTSSGRELALIEENKSKVSVYLEVYPMYLAETVMEKVYEPTSKNEGRHSNLQYISTKLGHSDRIYKMHIQSEEALEKLLHWYQYA